MNLSLRFIDDMTDQMKKIGILWGGGLGDLLMIRPLMAALQAEPHVRVFFLTTASHATELFEQFCAPATVVQLPGRAAALPGILRAWGGFFDLLYLGPYPTLKTRLLARLLRPVHIFSRINPDTRPFMLEQVLRDCAALGLRQPDPQTCAFKSLLPWPVGTAPQPFANARRYLVMHAGSKQRWETTRWPAEHWSRLASQLISRTGLGVCFVGTGAEEGHVRKITAELPAEAQERIAVMLNLPLRATAALIDAGSGVICHNSGILHLAAMLGKKTLCLTGSSAPYWQPPYAWIKNITSGACGLACNRYTCPVPFFQGKCIKNLTVEQVWTALVQHGLLNE